MYEGKHEAPVPMTESNAIPQNSPPVLEQLHKLQESLSATLNKLFETLSCITGGDRTEQNLPDVHSMNEHLELLNALARKANTVAEVLQLAIHG